MKSPRKIIGIMAVTEGGVIGDNNVLPWDYPSELEHFRSTISGQAVIMGHKTYETTPKSWMNKKDTIVFSRDLSLTLEHAIVVNSLKECLDYLQTLDEGKSIFMIGGGQIARLFLENDLISSFILTKIHKPYLGDTYLDLSFFEGWKENILFSSPDYTIFEIINPKEVQ